MNEDRPVEDAHYPDSGFPYAATGSYMDFYGGAAQGPLNYAHHPGTMHPQDNLYWTMNTNAYKFGFSGADNASFYGFYDMNDHFSRMSIGRTNWEYHHPMVNVDEPDNITVARSVDTDEHSEAEECIANEHEPDNPQSVSPSTGSSGKGSKPKCIMLDSDNSGQSVATGRVFSTDLEDKVHFKPLSPNASKVWVEVSKVDGARVWRPNSEVECIDDAVGTTMAWPNEKIVIL